MLDNILDASMLSLNTAWEGNTMKDFSSELAIDEDPLNTCSFIQMANPWWSVDLGGERSVTQVNLIGNQRELLIGVCNKKSLLASILRSCRI